MREVREKRIELKEMKKHTDKHAWRLGAVVLIRYLKHSSKSAEARAWHKMRTRFSKAANASLRRVVKEFYDADKATAWISKKYSLKKRKAKKKEKTKIIN